MAKSNGYNRNMRQKELVKLIIIFGVLILIFAGGLFFGWSNRDNIYNFLMGGIENKNNDNQNNDKNANDYEKNMNDYESFNVLDNINNDVEITSENKSESLTEKFKESESNIKSETEIKTEIQTKSESINENNLNNNSRLFEYTGEYQISDFMKQMLASATELGVEPPPVGRDMNLQSKIVPLSNQISEPYDFFKNIIFVGDSVTTGFDIYKAGIKFSGEPVLKYANVAASTSYGIYNATVAVSAKSVHPIYNGVQTKAEDIVANMQAQYVYICMGLNDLTWASPEKFVELYANLIDKISAKSPDKTIVICSVTPVIYGQKRGELGNENIAAANNLLIQFAYENNIAFLDYAAALRDENGAMIAEFSSDNYCHIKQDAYERLVEYILFHPIK